MSTAAGGRQSVSVDLTFWIVTIIDHEGNPVVAGIRNSEDDALTCARRYHRALHRPMITETILEDIAELMMQTRAAAPVEGDDDSNT